MLITAEVRFTTGDVTIHVGGEYAKVPTHYSYETPEEELTELKKLLRGIVTALVDKPFADTLIQLVEEKISLHTSQNEGG